MSDSPAPSVPAGALPLSWAESNDAKRNSQFEALSHLCANPDGTFCEYWEVVPVLEENRVFWRPTFSSALELPPEAFTLVNEGRFETADDAKAACEHMEVQLGGAARAPRMPVEDPHDAPPLMTDEHGFAPTRTVRSRWSKRDGVLYLFRVWAKPENPEQVLEKRLVGDEFEAALPGFITQEMVRSLVGSITSPGGWIVPLVWRTQALGEVRMECEVHFVNVRGLFWAKGQPIELHPTKADFLELPTPSHALICSIIGEELARKKADYDKTLATTSTEKLQREIVKNARALGIQSPMPEAEGDGGYVLPATLEHLQAAGMDLKGEALKR